MTIIPIKKPLRLDKGTLCKMSKNKRRFSILYKSKLGKVKRMVYNIGRRCFFILLFRRTLC